MKALNFRTTVHSITAILLLGVTVGCGNNSKDPMEDYPQLRNDRPPVAEEKHSQAEYNCSGRPVSASTMILSEGQTATQVVYLRGANVSPGEEVVLINAPAGMTHSRVGQSPEGLKFILKFTAARGTLKLNESYQASEFSVLPKSQLNSLAQCPEPIGLVITRTTDTPVISKIEAPQKLNLDSTQIQIISVDTKAQNLISASNLKIEKDNDALVSSKEKPVYDLSPALQRISEPKRLTNGLYRIQFSLNPAIVQILLADVLNKKTTQSEFEAVVQFTAKNLESGMSSPAENVAIKVVRAVKVEAAKVAAVKEVKP